MLPESLASTRQEARFSRSCRALFLPNWAALRRANLTLRRACCAVCTTQLSDCALKGACEIVCHGDASPGNCVFVDGMPSAFIDFDAAHPGSRLEDLGYAAWLWSISAMTKLNPEEPGRRVAQFFHNYGVDTDGAIDAVLAAQSALIERTGPPGVRGGALMVGNWAVDCRQWLWSSRRAGNGLAHDTAVSRRSSVRSA